MVACSNRMLKYCIIGMHIVYCVTHTEGGLYIVQAVSLAEHSVYVQANFRLFFHKIICIYIYLKKFIDIYTLNNSEKKKFVYI